MRDIEVAANGPADPGNEEAKALAKRAVARDPAAWEELFELHYRGIFAFVRYRLRSAEEAEDIASQAFEVAYARAHTFNYQGVPIGAWLMGIARNLVRDHIKKLGRRGIEGEFDESIDLSEPDEADAIGLRRDLLVAMGALTGDQRDVIELRFLLDRSVAETAVLMNRSEDAVKNLQRRALAAMQRALGGQGYGPGEST